MLKAKLTYAGKLITIFVVLLVGIGVAGVRYLRENPVGIGVRFVVEGRLPEGYIWEHTQGADFDVYYIRGSEQREAGIGIYLGHHPNFPYQADHLLCDGGQFLGVNSCWVVLDGKPEMEHTFYRTALLRYQYGIYAPIYIHIWVYANQEDDLEYLLDYLKHLRVKPALNVWELLIRGAKSRK